MGVAALDTAVKVLEFYEAKYQVKYPLPKVIPEPESKVVPRPSKLRYFFRWI